MNDRYHNSINSRLASAIDLVRSATKAIIRAHERWAAVRALSALNDRTLKDIGLHRSQIPSVVEQILKATRPSAVRNPTPAETTSPKRRALEVATNESEFESAA